jgi:hypothetical protein
VIAAPTGNIAASAFRIRADDVTIDGFRIEGTGTPGGMTWGVQSALGTRANGVIRNNVFRNLFEGVHLPGTNTAQNLTVERNAFRNEGSPFQVAAGLWLAAGTLQGATIQNNSFSGLDKGVGADITSINLNGSSDVVVRRNDSADDGSFLVVVNSSDIEVSDNTASDESGSSIFIGKNVADVVVVGNEITDGYRGIRLSNALGGATPTHDVMIIDNSISSIETAATLVDAGAVSGNLDIRGNRIVDTGEGIVNNSDVDINATDNWWGCNEGPGAGGCSTVSGPVDADPYMVLAAEASDDPILVGETSTITASLDTNSDGQPVELPVLEGREVSFATTGGTVEPAAAEITGGIASTGLSSATPLGNVTVSSTFDNATVTTDVFIGAAPVVGTIAIEGPGRVGEQLTCAVEGVTGLPTPVVTIGWLRDGTPIAGATSAVYTPAQGDVSSAVTCRVKAGNRFGEATKFSEPVTITGQPEPPAPKPPVVKPKPNVTVPKNGKVVIVTLKCPQGTCTVKAPKKVRVRIRGKVFIVKVKAPNRIGEKASGKVRLVLPPRARKALKGTRTKAKVRIVVTSSDGKRKVVDRRFVLKGKRR